MRKKTKIYANSPNFHWVGGENTKFYFKVLVYFSGINCKFSKFMFCKEMMSLPDQNQERYYSIFKFSPTYLIILGVPERLTISKIDFIKT